MAEHNETHELSDEQLEALNNGLPIQIHRPGEEWLQIDPPEE